MARYRAASAMAPIPFDRHGAYGTIEIIEDFIGCEDLGAAGELNAAVSTWQLDQTAGDSGSTVDLLPGVADHPGIIQIGTGGTTPADGDIATLSLGSVTDPGVDGDFLLDTNGIYVACVLRNLDVDASKIEFGLIGQAPAAVNSSALDLVSWVWDPEDAANVGDAFWFAQVNSNGTDTETVSTVSYVESDWVLLEIAADSASATFRITTEDSTETINSTPAAMPLVALTPSISVEAVGAAEEAVDVDLFVLRYLRRKEIFGTSGWLGA